MLNLGIKKGLRPIGSVGKYGRDSGLDFFKCPEEVVRKMKIIPGFSLTKGNTGLIDVLLVSGNAVLTTPSGYVKKVYR